VTNGPSGETAVRAPAPGPARGEGLALALLLAAAAVVAAILGARASLLASASSGLWQQSVRQEVKAAAAVVEDLRFVYGDEAAQAYRVVEAQVRADEFRKAAQSKSGVLRTLLLAEAFAYDQMVQALMPASEISRDPRYARPEGGFDLARRLADMRNRNPDLVAIDPEQPQRAGDVLSQHAALDTAATVPVALTFLFGSLAQAFGRWRRPLVAAAAVSLAVGIVAAIAIELVI
jgi:hypothetical protein